MINDFNNEYFKIEHTSSRNSREPYDVIEDYKKSVARKTIVGYVNIFVMSKSQAEDLGIKSSNENIKIIDYIMEEKQAR